VALQDTGVLSCADQEAAEAIAAPVPQRGRECQIGSFGAAAREDDVLCHRAGKKRNLAACRLDEAARRPPLGMDG
jgi:hypothetical protein